MNNDFSKIPFNIYHDELNYKQEMKQIFQGSTWNFVGFSSQVPKPGDYINSYVGETPVVLVRNKQNILKVFVNSCPHRGSQIIHQPKGNVKELTCPYHNWSFNLQGELKTIPFKQGIAGKGGISSCFDATQCGLQELVVQERNGIIFASYDKNIESLEQYFGPKILPYFDRICNGKKLKIIGKMSHTVACNWKFEMENPKDTIHAALLHKFFVNFGVWRSDQETSIVVDDSCRHSILISTATLDVLEDVKHLENDSVIDYESEFNDDITVTIMTFWPNLVLLQNLNNLILRTIRPTGVNSCIKTWTFLGYESDTPQLLARRLKQANMYGPSGLVTIDDNEIMALSHSGTAASKSTSGLLKFGQGTGDADHMISETAIRGFYKYYQQIMDTNIL
jgi:salicylate 5-hydroxylase large subunit